MRRSLASLALTCLVLAGWPLAAHAPAAVAHSGIATARAGQPDTGTDLRRERARKRAEARKAREEAQARGEDPSAAILDHAPPLETELLDAYIRHTETIASEQMAGREPGTPGIERAATYIEDHFAALGLKPVFRDDKGVPTFRQAYELERSIELRAASLSSAAFSADPVLDRDFTVLSMSGKASVEAPIVFVGYSIVAGPRGYLGYEPDTDLDGKIALMLRFEPMDTRGRSRWTRDGWSFQASMSAKVSAAARRNAEAVIVVAPPEARDRYARELEKTSEGKPEIEFEIPVVMVTQKVAEQLIAAGDTEQRTLRDLIALANESGTIINLSGARAAVSTDVERVAKTSDNVGAVLPGLGPLADEYVVIGAHYDHLGHGHFGSRSPRRAGEIHYGADDNASGTAAVMLAASLLSSDEQLEAVPNRRSVVFLLFTAEEKGLLGSKHYVQHPIAPMSDHAAMLNMDMIGRLRGKGVELGGMSSSQRLAAIATEQFNASGLKYFVDGSLGSGRSDHAPFDQMGVPNIFAFTGLHDDYHTADDTIDLLNFEGGARIARTIARVARAAAIEPGPLRDAAARPTQPPGQPWVRLGMVPQPDARGGLLVRRVFDGSSAQDAGIGAGERITQWNGEPVNTIADLNARLEKAKPGDVVTLTVVRLGEERDVEMTLRAPDE